MISLSNILLILLIHFLADFALQTDKQAKEKSFNKQQLLYHVATYSAVWFVASWAMLGFFAAILFTVVTFSTHYWIDYHSSRINKPFFKAGNYHDGFVVVGADQLVHYVQLFATYRVIEYIT